MRNACGLARDILLESADQIKPGITTGEVDEYAASLMKKKSCISAFLGYKQTNGPEFPGNVCISVNDEIVHGITKDIFTDSLKRIGKLNLDF